ncbi:GNAT family N-acetyltransferase [Actinopolymorpha sp. NPDC004070]|uniref:GNAT family N-acetyltransferase n=1 Tax=Actinopolymorpha sp. NPDC004070 TaxID=3154548 RepID=UPI0033B4583D
MPGTVSDVTIRPARPADTRSLSRVLALAFADDPVTSAILPDPAARPWRLRRMFATMARHFYLPHASSALADRDGTPVGAALWTPPGHAVPPWRAALSLPGLALATGRRLGAAARIAAALERSHPSQPHWYLAFVGVSPHVQGTGVGERLLQDHLADCDRDGLPAYLEASRPELTAYYERFGFAVTAEIPLPGGPPVWGMWREPLTPTRGNDMPALHTTNASETTEARPAHMLGHLAPVPDEITAADLPVTGTLPPELSGQYLRNGPNPLPGQRTPHWFTGSGMLHGVRIRDGRAEWYRNRWVRTRLLEGANPYGPHGTRDLAATVANTHIVEHGGRLLALCEGGLPYEVTPDLDTVGPCDFGGRLTTAMTAHPKTDPVTGELFFFGYSVTHRPYVTYHRMSADGQLQDSVAIDVPGPTMMHDFAITAHHVVWLDLPLTFHPELGGKGMPFQWDDDYGARLGVMRRDGTGGVRWFDVEPCYVFHVGNAHEQADGRIVLDVVRYSRSAWDSSWARIGGDAKADGAGRGLPGGPAGMANAVAETGVSALYRWVLDPRDGSVSEQPLDDLGVEFPTHDETRTGLGSRYLYTVGTVGTDEDGAHTGRPGSGAIVKYDVESGNRQYHDLGPEIVPGEAIFVPAEGVRREDDGWLLTVVTDKAGSGSDLLVLDASDVTGPPVATVHLPRRVPAGFHGSWIPDHHDNDADHTDEKGFRA